MEENYLILKGQVICIKLCLSKETKEIFLNGLDSFMPYFIKKRDADGILIFKEESSKKEVSYKEIIAEKKIFEQNLIIKKIKDNLIKGEYCFKKDFVLEPVFMQQVFLNVVNEFSKACVKYTKSLIFHASGLSKNGNGYIFVGESGSGKSTICRLLTPIGLDIIHEDSIVIKPEKEDFVLYPPFFCFKTRCHIVGKKPKKIFFINKSKINKLEKMSLKEAVGESFKHCRSITSTPISIDIFNNFIDLFKSIPTYRLFFKKDPSFWRLIK